MPTKTRLTPPPPPEHVNSATAIPRAPAVAPVDPSTRKYVNSAQLRPRQSTYEDEQVEKRTAPQPIRKKRTVKIDQKRTLNFTESEIEMIDRTYRAMSRHMIEHDERLNLYDSEIPRIAIYLLQEKSVEELMEILDKMPRFRK